MCLATRTHRSLESEAGVAVGPPGNTSLPALWLASFHGESPECCPCLFPGDRAIARARSRQRPQRLRQQLPAVGGTASPRRAVAGADARARGSEGATGPGPSAGLGRYVCV